MCGQYNVRAIAGDNTDRNTKDIHPVPGGKLKFVPSGNRTRATGSGSMDSTDHAPATDTLSNFNIKINLKINISETITLFQILNVKLL